VKPDALLRGNNAVGGTNKEEEETPKKAPERILTAYLEPIDQSTWTTKPLPQRTWTSEDLVSREFPQLSSCQNLPEQFPVDNFPGDEDPFLPWIHDVFPTHDGKHIQFVAQNKRRCRTGHSPEDIEILKDMAPQVALFQHVPIKRVNENGPKYRLSSHEDAHPDGTATRFICKFQPSGQETLSEFNFDYEWASFRKRNKKLFNEDGRDNKAIHTSQLLFMCPVPENLVELVKSGKSVIDDYATLFVDLIPIRTPPRYTAPNAFLQPYYSDHLASESERFDPHKEWGENHVLPKIQDSGRWANIPICKPTLLTYGKQKSGSQQDKAVVTVKDDEEEEEKPVKEHRLAACLWASSGYATRGNRFAINDGQRRLLEWVTYNKLIGVEHFYLYDNSGAFSDDPANSLQPVADLFPDDITVIRWPSQVCNNNPNNVDSVGERSSQYAAESSCRLRFGTHVDWMAQFDIDEYLVPMGNLTTIHPLLDKLEGEDKKIVSFGSWRAWPRRRFIEEPQETKLFGAKDCGRKTACFQLRIPMKHTMLQAYNCDRQKPGEKTERMPAEKQLYRPDYVKHHFIHYSTVTVMSIWNKKDTLKHGYQWKVNPFPDPLSRFGNEVSEGLMLHTKAVATQDTTFWETACKAEYEGGAFCRLGSPFPDSMTGVNVTEGDEGWKFNCYVNHKIDDYWVKRLENDMKKHVPEIAEKLGESM